MTRKILAMVLVAVMAMSFAISASAGTDSTDRYSIFQSPVSDTSPVWAQVRYKYSSGWSTEFKGSEGLLAVDVGNEQLYKYGLYTDPAGEQHYFDGNGNAVKSAWQLIDGKYYYFMENGLLAKNTWVGNYYVNGSGVWVENPSQSGWVYAKSGKRGWKYIKDNGEYAKGWLQIVSLDIDAGQSYHNGSDLASSTIKAGQKFWYYFNNQGYLITNSWIDGKYYVGEEGIMATDAWIRDANGNKKWYVDQNGAWVPGYEKADTDYVWLERGNLASLNERYYYKINGKEVYAKNQWIGDVYYNANGYRVFDQWVDDKLLDSNGICVKASMDNALLSGEYYKTHNEYNNTNSKLVRKTKDGYYIGEDGVAVKNIWLYDVNYNDVHNGTTGGWLYIGANYKPAANVWVDNVYYVNANGYMLRNAWVGEYFVGNDGRWVE